MRGTLSQGNLLRGTLLQGTLRDNDLRRYWVNIRRYWLVFGGTGSVWGTTGWYLVILVQYKLVLFGIKWNLVKKGLLCLYILKKLMVTSTNRPTNRQGEYRAICLFRKLENRKKAEICNLGLSTEYGSQQPEQPQDVNCEPIIRGLKSDILTGRKLMANYF